MMRKAAAVLTAICCLVANQAIALGLGSLTLESALNQPLRARIEIVDLGGVSPAEITVQLASDQEFQRFDLERTNFLANIDFQVQRTADGVYVVLTSSQAVREPYLNFILDTRWPSGRILSEHTVLLDLPVFSDGRSVAQPINQPVSPALEPQQGVVERQQAASAAVPAEPAVAEQPSAATPQPEPEAQRPAAEPAPRTEPVISAPPVLPDSLEIQQSDTLWEIAMRVRPSDAVSIQQTMLAIQRLNPDAFIGGNINRLQAGASLQIPDLSDIQSINQQQAVSEVSRQNQQADLNVEPLTAPASGPSSQSAAASQGQLRVLTAEDAQPTGIGGSAAVEAQNDELDARIQALENQLALQEEEADRARVQQSELLSRLEDLDQQIASALEIIRLQDQQLAQLQASLAEATAEAAAQQQTASVAEPAPVARPLPQQPVAPSFMDSVTRVLSNSSMVLAVVVILVVLLMVMLLMRRNRVATAEGLEEDYSADLDAESADQELPTGSDLEDRQPGQHYDDEIDAEAALAGAVPGAVALADTEDYDEDQDRDELESVEAHDEVAEHELAGWDDEDEELPLETADLEAGSDFDPEELFDDEPATEADHDSGEPELDEAVAEDAGEMIDFELESGDEQAEADDDDVEVLDFDIDDFLDDEDEQSAVSDLTDSSTDVAAKAAASGVDFELDTEAEEQEEGVGQQVTNEGVEFSPSAVEETTAAEDLDDASANLAEEADDDQVETLDFDLGGTGIDEFDSEQPEADGTDDDIETLDFGADDEQPEFTGQAGGAETEPQAGSETVDFELDGQESDTDNAELTEMEQPEEPEMVDFDIESLDDTDDREDSADTEESEESPISIDFEADSDEAGSTPDIEVDLSADEQEPERHIEIEFDYEDEEGDTEAAQDSAGTAQEQDDVLVDLTDEPLQDDEPAPTAQQGAEAMQPGEDEIDDIEVDADADTTLEAASEAGESTVHLEKSAANEQSDDTDQGATEISVDDDELEQVAAGNTQDEVGEVLRQDEEAGAPDSAIELDDLDFFSAEKDSAVDGAEEDIAFLSDDDEAATKLDLAYAYQKMGDVDGAKEILEEVINEGNDAQISEARNLMAALQK